MAANKYKLSPIKGILKNNVVSKDGPDTEILTTAMKFGFITKDEFEVLQAIKQKNDITLSTRKLNEVLTRLHQKNLIEMVE